MSSMPSDSKHADMNKPPRVGLDMQNPILSRCRIRVDLHDDRHNLLALIGKSANGKCRIRQFSRSRLCSAKITRECWEQREVSA